MCGIGDSSLSTPERFEILCLFTKRIVPLLVFPELYNVPWKLQKSLPKKMSEFNAAFLANKIEEVLLYTHFLAV